MQQYRDAVISSEQMLIIKKFDETVNYLYPILQNAPRKQSVTTAKKKIRRYIKQGRREDLRKFLASWSGHTKWADSKNLTTSVEKMLCAEN